MKPEEAMLVAEDFAAALGLHVATARRLMKRGDIPSEERIGGRKGSMIANGATVIEKWESEGKKAQAEALRRHIAEKKPHGN